MTQSFLPLTDSFFSVMTEEKVWANPDSLAHHLGYLFGGISFQGKTVLDIGAGAGLFSFYAARCGAKKVVSLEPEIDGSNSKMIQTFHTLQNRLGCDTVELQTQRFQEFDTIGEQFDLILMHNSINHLDEEACIHLRKSEKAIITYQTLFRKLYGMAREDAILIVADCSRYNLFRYLPFKNPFAPSIEWDKHQSPKLWSRLLEHASFIHPQITWGTPYKTRAINRFLANRYASFFWVSHFCLRMKK